MDKMIKENFTKIKYLAWVLVENNCTYDDLTILVELWDDPDFQELIRTYKGRKEKEIN